jgi:uncharacterized protein (DUF1499 family)
VPECIKLFSRFYTFGHNIEVKILGKSNDRGVDRVVLSPCPDRPSEGLTNLDDIDGEGT